MTSSNRIVGLDGLRAISISFVLVAHVFGSHEILDLGTLGVRVFFIISGYLITRLLLSELSRTETISLKKFYIRRTFRIFPAFYLYVAVVVLLSSLGAFELGDRDLLGAVTYTMNYQTDRAWQLGHLWSLAVEEQFYLLWPAALLLAGPRRGGVIALLIICLGPIVRVATWYFLPDMRESIGESFETVADSLATGCALAYFATRLESVAIYQRALKSRALLSLVVIGIFALYYMRGHIRMSYPVGETLINLGIAFVIHAVVSCHQGRMYKVLNAGPVVWLGQLSYSLYLWQQLFLNKDSDHVTAQFPLSVLLALVAAVLSFYLVERPFLRLRQRLMSRMEKR